MGRYNTPAHFSIFNTDGRLISIANNTLTINGTISGTGTITGSVNSNLVLNGKTGTLTFSQNNSSEHSLLSLTINQGSNVLLATDAEVTSLNVHPAANLIIASGVNLITH